MIVLMAKQIIISLIFAAITALLTVYADGDIKIKRTFVIDEKANCFKKDGKCFQYVSGSLHYFRVPRVYWNDRLKKAKALGLNTIQTYIPWNFHEERIGQFDFEAQKDIIHFLKLAQINGLLTILRIGPYIDAEWEHGGVPWWLGKFLDINIRTLDVSFLNYVENWWTVLIQKIKPFLYGNGGPIIAFQVENEYGNYYACDKKYLNYLSTIARKLLGHEVVLFTTDGYTDADLKCGTIQALYKTIDFGTEISPIEAFKQQRKYQNRGPLVNSEYYTGWLDYWGSIHHRKDAKEIALGLAKILETGASVSLYMYHGGTNFGWMNGVDMQDSNFLISPTSYDYDAPLSESGDTTYKYSLIRNVIQSHFKTKLPPIPKNTTKIALGSLTMRVKFNLYDILSANLVVLNSKKTQFPLTMEDLDFSYGFVVYETLLPDLKGRSISLKGGQIHDRFLLFVDEKLEFIGRRGLLNETIKNGEKISILIENEGRVTYAEKGKKYLPDRKGILGNITANGKILDNWQCFHLNESILLNVNPKISERSNRMPMMFEGFIFTKTLADSFLLLDMPAWGKGQVFINENNVGRFWATRGPQKTLYIPKSMLRKGWNKVRVFETENFNPSDRILKFIDFPILS